MSEGQPLRTVRPVPEGAGQSIPVRPAVHTDPAVESALRQRAAEREEAEAQVEEKISIEIVDTLELQLPNGKTVLMGAPATPTAFAAARLLKGEDAQNGLLQAYTKALLYVRAVNGAPVRPLANQVDLHALANDLGDGGVDHVATAWNEYWPQPTKDTLVVLKKNLRG